MASTFSLEKCTQSLEVESQEREVDALKLESDKPNAKANSGQRLAGALGDPGLSADRGELDPKNNSNVDFSLLRVYNKDTKHCQYDKGHANHLHLPFGLFRKLTSSLFVSRVLTRCLAALPGPLPWLDPLANKDSGGPYSLRTLRPPPNRKMKTADF